MTVEEKVKKISLNVGVDPEKVKCILMGENSASTVEKPCLYTFALSTCVGLLAKTDGFAFLAHIDMGGLVGRSFERKWTQLPDGHWNGKIIGCDATKRMYSEIRRNKDLITSPIEISLIYGDFYCSSGTVQEELLNKGIDKVLMMCENDGLEAVRTEPIYSTSVLVDSRSGEVFLGDALDSEKKNFNFIDKNSERVSNQEENADNNSKNKKKELMSMLDDKKEILMVFLDRFRCRKK